MKRVQNDNTRAMNLNDDRWNLPPMGFLKDTHPCRRGRDGFSMCPIQSAGMVAQCREIWSERASPSQNAVHWQDMNVLRISRIRVGITCLALLSLRVAGAQPVSPHQADLIRNQARTTSPLARSSTKILRALSGTFRYESAFLTEGGNASCAGSTPGNNTMKVARMK